MAAASYQLMGHEADVQVTESPDNFKAATCLVVTSVATGGIAWEEGVRAGDLLLSVNGVAAVDLGERLFRADMRKDGIALWLFRRHRVCGTQSSQVEVRTASMCIGITAELSADAAEEILHCGKPVAVRNRGNLWGLLQDQWKPSASPDVYWTLWENGRWESLKDRMPSWNQRPACMSKFLALAGDKSTLPRDPDPWTLLSAAADYELGNQAAIEGIADFWMIEENWTSNYHAMVRFYFARDLLRPCPHGLTLQVLPGLVEDETQALDTTIKDLLVEAWACGSPRMNALIAEHVPASLLEKPAFVSFEFPSYELPVLLSKQGHAGCPTPHVSTISVTDAIQRSPFLLVVILGGYRVNGPYMQFMSQWIYWAESFSQFGLLECHVITSTDAPENSNPRIQSMLRSERQALRADAPGLTWILHDPEETVERALQVHVEVEGYPFCVLLRGQDVVMHSDRWEFDDVTLYEALTSAGR